MLVAEASEQIPSRQVFRLSAHQRSSGGLPTSIKLGSGTSKPEALTDHGGGPATDSHRLPYSLPPFGWPLLEGWPGWKHLSDNQSIQTGAAAVKRVDQPSIPSLRWISSSGTPLVSGMMVSAQINWQTIIAAWNAKVLPPQAARR